MPRPNLEQDRHSLCKAQRSSPSDRLARERHRHAVDAAASGGEEVELGIQDLEPLAALIRALWRGETTRSPPSANRLHDIAITSR
jgi:hypothetical protein